MYPVRFLHEFYLKSSSYDAELPIDCDDEYWEHGYQQPANQPSKVTYYILLLRLQRIQTAALRALVRDGNFVFTN
jgi:hypothetical protein